MNKAIFLFCLILNLPLVAKAMECTSDESGVILKETYDAENRAFEQRFCKEAVVKSWETQSWYIQENTKQEVLLRCQIYSLRRKFSPMDYVECMPAKLDGVPHKYYSGSQTTTVYRYCSTQKTIPNYIIDDLCKKLTTCLDKGVPPQMTYTHRKLLQINSKFNCGS